MGEVISYISVSSSKPLPQEVISHIEWWRRFWRVVKHSRTVSNLRNCNQYTNLDTILSWVEICPSNLLFKLCKNIIQFKVPKLFENFIIAFNLWDKTIEVSMRQLSKVRKFCSMVWRDYRSCRNTWSSLENRYKICKILIQNSFLWHVSIFSISLWAMIPILDRKNIESKIISNIIHHRYGMNHS